MDPPGGRYRAGRAPGGAAGREGGREGALCLWLFPRVAAQPGESRAGSGLGGMPLSHSPAAEGFGWGGE